MGRLSKLTEQLKQELFTMHSQGMSCGKLANWLFENHGIKLTPDGILHHIKIKRKEYELMTAGVVAECVQNSVRTDIERLDTIVKKLEDQCLKNLENNTILDPKIAFPEYYKFLALKLKLTGALDTTKEDKEEDISKALLEKLGL
jgi:hypothetical protein